MRPTRIAAARAGPTTTTTPRHPVAAAPTRLTRARALLLAATLALPLLVCSACSALRAGRLLADALAPPPDSAALIDVREVDVATRAGPVRVVVARPRDDDGALPAIVLVHGAVDAGARERRLLSFARSFAARGMVVATPHLESLARFRLDPDDPLRVAGVARWLADSTAAESGQVALAGVSVGASYALLAAAEPTLRADVSAVLSFGGYADLGALLQHWMTQPATDHGDLFDPLTEGRRLVLLGNVDHLVEEPYRAEVRRRLRAILDGHSTGSDGLPAGAAEVVAVAQSTEPLAPAHSAALLARMAPALDALSPAARAAPAAPVYLLHGESDPVVPVTDLAQLAAALRARGATVATHVTALFDHVDARGNPGLVAAWPLLCFVGDFLDDSGL